MILGAQVKNDMNDSNATTLQRDPREMVLIDLLFKVFSFFLIFLWLDLFL